MWRFHADCPSRNWKTFDIDFIHDPIRVFMCFFLFFRKLQVMCFWKIWSSMRHLPKPSCGKWPYIDPLVMRYSSKNRLLPVFYIGNVSFPWKVTFSFGATWSEFVKDSVVSTETSPAVLATPPAGSESTPGTAQGEDNRRGERLHNDTTRLTTLKGSADSSGMERDEISIFTQICKNMK